jgi:ureidoacrylate peracid hydrolase
MPTATAIVMVDMQNMYLEQDRRDLYGWPPIWDFGRVVQECADLLAEARA